MGGKLLGWSDCDLELNPESYKYSFFNYIFILHPISSRAFGTWTAWMLRDLLGFYSFLLDIVWHSEVRSKSLMHHVCVSNKFSWMVFV